MAAGGAYLTHKYLCRSFKSKKCIKISSRAKSTHKKKKKSGAWSRQNENLTHLFQWELKRLLSGQWIFNAEKGCFNKKVCRPKTCWTKSVLGELLLLLWKKNIRPWILKGTITKQRERRRDSSACLCGKFEVKSGLKGDNFSSRPQLCL